MCEQIKFNVGGTIFVTTKSTLSSMPDTKLGKLLIGKDNYDGTEFYFDRNPDSFNCILDYYRAGELHVPTTMCAQSFKNELRFWEIEDCDIATCCIDRYSENDDNSVTDFSKYFGNVSQISTDLFILEESKVAKWRIKAYNFLEDPRTSRAAKIPMVLYCLATLTICLLGFLAVNESFRVPLDNATVAFNMNNTHFESKKLIFLLTTRMNDIIIYSFLVVSPIVLIDLPLRFTLCPHKRSFFKSFWNILDIFIVASMAISAFFEFRKASTYSDVTLSSKIAISGIRAVLMIIRLLKYGSHSVGLRVLFLTIKSSLGIIGYLAAFMASCAVFFAILIYVTELTTDQYFPDIFPTGLWWAFITMTTVGYGDMYPVGTLGYGVGTCCVLVGLVLTSLPIAVLSSNFDMYLKRAKDYEARKQKQKQRSRSESAKRSVKLLNVE